MWDRGRISTYDGAAGSTRSSVWIRRPYGLADDRLARLRRDGGDRRPCRARPRQRRHAKATSPEDGSGTGSVATDSPAVRHDSATRSGTCAGFGLGTGGRATPVGSMVTRSRRQAGKFGFDSDGKGLADRRNHCRRQRVWCDGHVDHRTARPVDVKLTDTDSGRHASFLCSAARRCSPRRRPLSRVRRGTVTAPWTSSVHRVGETCPDRDPAATTNG